MIGVPVVSLRSHRPQVVGSAGWAGDGEEVGRFPSYGMGMGRHGGRRGAAFIAPVLAPSCIVARGQASHQSQSPPGRETASIRQPSFSRFPASLCARPNSRITRLCQCFPARFGINFRHVVPVRDRSDCEKAFPRRGISVSTIVSRDFSRTFVLVEIFTATVAALRYVCGVCPTVFVSQ
nr:PREDICTED: uncharacterized protein LOC109040765 [Bemisia tabaci]